MTVLKKIKSHSDVINCFKELRFYNTYIKKAKIKPLKIIDLLSELPFYEELNVIKTDRDFREYAMLYRVEIVGKKDPLIHSEASKPSIKILFNDLLDETKGFKYQITGKILLKQCKGTETEFFPVYFYSKTKIVINHRSDLDKSFQEILCRVDNWINKSSD